MSENVIIALIGLLGAILTAAITGFATIQASKSTSKTRSSSRKLGLSISLGAVFGVLIGIIIGNALIRPQGSPVELPPVVSSTPDAVTPIGTSLLGRIAFASDRDGKYKIYSIHVDGSALKS